MIQPVVSTIMAKAYNASIVQSWPRHTFTALPVVEGASVLQAYPLERVSRVKVDEMVPIEQRSS